MSPPLYADLGKGARDIFSRGYNLDTIKLDLKTKTKAGVEFSTGGVSHLDSGKVLGTLETKYKFKEYGITFTEKWNTSNILATEVVWQDFVQGAKLAAEYICTPNWGQGTSLKERVQERIFRVNMRLQLQERYSSYPHGLGVWLQRLAGRLSSSVRYKGFQGESQQPGFGLFYF